MRTYHFISYIFGLQSIWFLHFDNSQFGPCYFLTCSQSGPYH